uniref:Uncharacterized protein n=1 Tax=Lepeophtheirus salmonis TaxID=72036 RepID=A0A0K2TVJ6_LEPSM
MDLQVIEETLTVGEPGGLHGPREDVLFGHSVGPVPKVLIHNFGDKLLAHSTVLGQPGQGSPRQILDGLLEAFKEAGSADSVTSRVVGLAADLPLNLPGIEDPVHRGLGVVKKLEDSRGLVSRASQFEDGVSPCLFHDDYCLLSKQLWWKL